MIEIRKNIPLNGRAETKKNPPKQKKISPKLGRSKLIWQFLIFNILNNIRRFLQDSNLRPTA